MPYRIRKVKCKRSDGKSGSYVLEYIPKGKRKYKRAGCHTSKKNASGQRAAIEGGPREADDKLNEMDTDEAGKKDQNNDGKNDFDDVKIARMLASGMTKDEIKKKHPNLFERKDSNHPQEYKAPEGSKRDKQLDATQADLKSGDPERVARAYRRREKMEKKERSKKGFKNKPRKDTKSAKNESIEETIMMIVETLLLEMDEAKKKKKAAGKLSKKTKETLKKKAEKRGFTPGSVYAEYRKGLAAWASSGSRKGMSQHQWAHARVNSATPSKPWAVVKKSKAKKKK